MLVWHSRREFDKGECREREREGEPGVGREAETRREGRSAPAAMRRVVGGIWQEDPAGFCRDVQKREGGWLVDASSDQASNQRPTKRAREEGWRFERKEGGADRPVLQLRGPAH